MDDMLANHRTLLAAQLAAIPYGLYDGAAVVQDAMQATTAYVGMSGATRASSVAYVATAQDPGDPEAAAAYAEAVAHLTGFTGHTGRPQLTGAAGPGAGQAWVVATVPTDYAINLEMDNAGQKAFIADSLLADAPTVTTLLIVALRDGWRLA